MIKERPLLERPFQAYTGEEAFIFASYSHDDQGLVYPELERLKSLGFNVWYDEGIRAGQDWTDELAHRLGQCALAVYFITPNSVLSRHCANEVHFALDQERPVLLVHLRPAKLPPGLRLQLSSIQGIVKHEIGEQEYVRKLKSAIEEMVVPAARIADAAVSEAAEVARLPMGKVTMLRFDIVDNHTLAADLGDRYADVILRWRHLARGIIGQSSGHEVELRGDTCLAAFINSGDALRAAMDIQWACEKESWPLDVRVRVRMGVHTGQPLLVDNHYLGIDVHRLTSIALIGVGGQILVSATTRKEIGDADLPQGVTIRDLGSHRLKDSPYPEWLFDLCIPGLDHDFAPIASLSNRPSNLPKAMSSFVGRKRELAAITALLQRQETRIVTLTGAGGSGKSRLSIEAARLLESEFPDGVFMVRLASVADPGQVISAIAEALDIKELMGQTPLQALVHRLAGSRILLVLDNFEQVVEAATKLLDLLSRCPGLKILVSSREALNLQAESEYPVEPLQLPAKNAARDLDQMREVEAVKLFVDRVQEYQPDFELRADNAPYIAKICTRLDGLPLALELAAARLNILSPRDLEETLASSLDVLKSKSRDLPERQRTLRSTVEWSYNLLDKEERELFAQLAVFRGGFTISAAQLVLADYHDKIALLEGIESLVDKNLLKQEASPLEARFWMLETIREYGADKLAEHAEAGQIRQSHALHFLELAESMAPGLTGHQQRQCVTGLLGDKDNLRAVMAWALDQGELEIMGRLLQALLWLWLPRGQFTECRSWIGQALERFDDREPCREKAVLHEIAAWTNAMSGDYVTGLDHLEFCQDTYRGSGGEADLARIEAMLGMAKAQMQDPLGRDLCSGAAQVFESVDDAYHLAVAKTALGITHLFVGEVPMAAELWEQALDIFRRIGNSYWPGQLLQNLAHFRLMDGDWKGALERFRESMEIAREFDYPIVFNLAVAGLAAVAVVLEEPEAAARLFGSVRASLDKLGVSFEPLDQESMNRYLELAKEKMTEQAFQQAFAQGAAWSEQEIWAAALAVGPE